MREIEKEIADLRFRIDEVIPDAVEGISDGDKKIQQINYLNICLSCGDK